MVGAAHQQPHGVGALVVADLDDSGRTADNDLDRSRHRHTSRNPVDERRHSIGADGKPSRERQRRCRGMLRYDANDLRVEAQQIANCDETADPGSQSHRHVDDVELTGGAEELVRVGGYSAAEVAIERRHGFEAALLSQQQRVLEGRLEIDTMLDQLGAETTHRRVLVGAVAVRHDDRDRQTGGAAGERHTLAMVAAGRADHAVDVRPLANQAVDVHQATAHFERSCRRAVLVLQPDLGPHGLVEQWPGELRCRRHVSGHDLRGVSELVDGEERHADTTMSTRTSWSASGISSTS